MERTFTCIFLLIIISFAGNTHAQSKSPALQGTVTDEKSAATEGATVALLRYPDSSYVRATATDKKGVFLFSNIKTGQYLVLITKTGFHRVYSSPQRVVGGNVTKVDPIRLKTAAVNLGEVVVLDKRRYLDIRSDRTILNLDGNILATGTSVLNVLSTAPGVKVSTDGDVSLRAGQRAGILVNGKQIRLQGADLNTYLQNLQTAGVDQIELITNPSAKYDAAGTGGVINIILKRGRNEGLNGSVTTTAGYGRYGKAGTNLTWNYRSKTLNIFGGAGYDYSKTYQTFTNLRNVHAANLATFDSRYNSTQSSPKLNYRLGADFFIDSAHTLGFLVIGSNNVAHYDKQTDTYMFLNNRADSTFNTGSSLKRTTNNNSYNINYAGNLGKTSQTLSADLDLAVFNRRSNEDIISKGMSDALVRTARMGAFNNDTLNNYAPTHIINQSAKVDYVNLLNKSSRLEGGLKASYVKSTNSQYFTLLQNNTYILYPLFTSFFNYTEKVGSAYVNYIYEGKKISYTAGLRFEHTNSDANRPADNYDVKRDYSNFYPSVQIAYQLQNSSELTLAYNRRILPLDYSIVNPIIAYQDNYNYTKGNQYLRPAYSNKVELAYHKRNFIASLYAQQISDFYDFTFFVQNDSSKVLTTTKTNIKRALLLGTVINLPVQAFKWWNLNLNADISYQRYQSYNGILNKGTKDIILALDQNFKLARTLSATIHTQYESSTFFGISYLKPSYYTSAGILKQFNSVTSLALSADDIFNTNRDRYRMTLGNLDINGYHKRESQIVRLSFVYRFGKRSIKAARRHTTGNNEELKRMNGGS